MSHEELVSHATILFFAGVDTTSTALTYIAYVLAKHPEYIEKLEKEVSSHYKDVDEFQSIELEKLPLLNAVIREALRLYPPAPGPIGRLTPTEGAVIGGYTIPGGVLSQVLSI
jgi:cytochrome P450